MPAPSSTARSPRLRCRAGVGGLHALSAAHAGARCRRIREVRGAARRVPMYLYASAHWAQRDAVAIDADQMGQLHREGGRLAHRAVPEDPLDFDTDAAYGMATFMPLPMMAQVVLAPGLPPNIKRDLALAVWTRAVLLDDAATARRWRKRLRRSFRSMPRIGKPIATPPAPRPERSRRRSSCSSLPAARARIPIRARLHVPARRDRASSAALRAVDDTPISNHDNVTSPACGDCALPVPLIAPPFITDWDKQIARTQSERLGKLPGGLAWLGAIVIPWARRIRAIPGFGGAPQRGTGDRIRRGGFRDVRGCL